MACCLCKYISGQKDEDSAYMDLPLIKIEYTISNVRIHVFLVALLIYMPLTHEAQIQVDQDRLSRHQLRLSLTGASYDPLSLHNTGAQLFNSGRGISGEFAIIYSMPLFKSFRFNVGMGYANIPTRYSYDVNDLSGSAFTASGYDLFTTRGINPRFSQGIWTFPFSIERSFLLSKRQTLGLNIEAGFKINVKQAYEASWSGGSSAVLHDNTTLPYMDFKLKSVGERMFMTYILKAGLVKAIKDGNTLHMNAVYQYGPSDILQGNYGFYNLGFTSQGTMSQRSNYFGLEFAFGIGIRKSK